MFVKVKICGITNIEDAKAAIDCGADAIGFIFYKKSPRYVSPEEAAKIRAIVHPLISVVGVFVDSSCEEIKRTIDEVRLDLVQLHGNEPLEFCRLFQSRVIKAFRIENESALDICKKYSGITWLLDAFKPNLPGGTGAVFDWNIARKAKLLNPNIILSGGLTEENVSDAIRAVQPIAVDVSSGVEIFPGKKDHLKIKRFIYAAKTALIST